jgi:hypothetical protein
MFNKLTSAALALPLLAALALPAHAADAPPAAGAKPPSPQQQRMKQCNAQAKAAGKKGDERKTFMKGCLSKKA